MIDRKKRHEIEKKYKTEKIKKTTKEQEGKKLAREGVNNIVDRECLSR